MIGLTVLFHPVKMDRDSVGNLYRAAVKYSRTMRRFAPDPRDNLDSLGRSQITLHYVGQPPHLPLIPPTFLLGYFQEPSQRVPGSTLLGMGNQAGEAVHCGSNKDA